MQFVEPIRNKCEIDKVKTILRRRCKRDLLLFLLGINSGLRISDILKFKVRDVQNVDFIEIKEQKTQKHKRFPVSYAYKRLLNNYTNGKSPDEWLFKSKKGERPITRVQAYRIISRACEKAGITTKIGTHTLRKTFGYHFYQEKKDIALLQTIFNHSTPTVTLRYIGINQDMIDSNLKSFSL